MDNNMDLMNQFSRATILLHRYQHHNRKEQGPFADPHRGQGRILALLKMQPEISQKDLSYLLDMRNQSLSELLTKLEKAGYVTRTQSEKDRRVMDIRLTNEGKEAANQAEQGKQDSGQIFDCLDEVERKNLSEYLARIITELEKQLGGEIEFPDAWGPRGTMPEMIQHLRERGYPFEGFDRRGFFSDRPVTLPAPPAPPKGHGDGRRPEDSGDE